MNSIGIMAAMSAQKAVKKKGALSASPMTKMGDAKPPAKPNALATFGGMIPMPITQTKVSAPIAPPVVPQQPAPQQGPMTTPAVAPGGMQQQPTQQPGPGAANSARSTRDKLLLVALNSGRTDVPWQLLLDPYEYTDPATGQVVTLTGSKAARKRIADSGAPMPAQMVGLLGSIEAQEELDARQAENDKAVADAYSDHEASVGAPGYSPQYVKRSDVYTPDEISRMKMNAIMQYAQGVRPQYIQQGLDGKKAMLDSEVAERNNQEYAKAQADSVLRGQKSSAITSRISKLTTISNNLANAKTRIQNSINNSAKGIDNFTLKAQANSITALAKAAGVDKDLMTLDPGEALTMMQAVDPNVDPKLALSKYYKEQALGDYYKAGAYDRTVHANTMRVMSKHKIAYDYATLKFKREALQKLGERFAVAEQGKNERFKLGALTSLRRQAASLKKGYDDDVLHQQDVVKAWDTQIASFQATAGSPMSTEDSLKFAEITRSRDIAKAKLNELTRERDAAAKAATGDSSGLSEMADDAAYERLFNELGLGLGDVGEFSPDISDMTEDDRATLKRLEEASKLSPEEEAIISGQSASKSSIFGGKGSVATSATMAVKELKGTPYDFGGNSKNGIDCSAFTMRVAKAAGRNIPRTAREQYKYIKQNVPLDQIQPGDFIFLQGTQKALGPGEASHVMIYLGDGKVAQSGGSTNGVGVRKLSGYDERHFLGIKRL